jgi:hypothetical protein
MSRSDVKRESAGRSHSGRQAAVVQAHFAPAK